MKQSIGLTSTYRLDTIRSSPIDDDVVCGLSFEGSLAALYVPSDNCVAWCVGVRISSYSNKDIGMGFKTTIIQEIYDIYIKVPNRMVSRTSPKSDLWIVGSCRHHCIYYIILLWYEQICYNSIILDTHSGLSSWNAGASWSTFERTYKIKRCWMRMP